MSQNVYKFEHRLRGKFKWGCFRNFGIRTVYSVTVEMNSGSYDCNNQQRYKAPRAKLSSPERYAKGKVIPLELSGIAKFVLECKWRKRKSPLSSPRCMFLEVRCKKPAKNAKFEEAARNLSSAFCSILVKNKGEEGTAGGDGTPSLVSVSLLKRSKSFPLVSLKK